MIKSSIPFRGFDEQREMRIYSSGILPHWRQTGCTYFVTFRLADSIPAKVLEAIEFERKLWLSHRDVNANDPNWKQQFAQLSAAERKTYEKQVGWLINKSLDECHGACSIKNPIVSRQVASALEYFHGERVFTGDFVVMPNHVHVLMTPIEGFELEDVLHSIKSFSANQINRTLSRSGPFWQRDNYDHIVRDMEQLVAYQEYIAANPEKANLKAVEFIYARAMYSFT